jgi:replication factor A1
MSSLVCISGLEILVKETGTIGKPIARTMSPPAAGTTSTPPNAERPSGSRTTPSEPIRSTLPINVLNPYSNNWTIKARVTHRSEIRNWSNQRGQGKLFNVTLMDETDEISGTGFNSAVDQLYSKFEEGKVYYVSKARVNLANKQFNKTANDYELSLDKNTQVEEVRPQRYHCLPLEN